nr:hypothetical protein [uncultured Tyzzerella sp.]
MKISIVEEDDNKIVLEYQDVKCPNCSSDDLVIQQSFNDSYLDTLNLKEFLKKDTYIKKVRYKCKCCNKTFVNKTRFTDRIFDKDFKPFLRLLLDKNLLKVFEINPTVLEKLNIDYKWSLLRAGKIITVINIYTLEIREFSRIVEKERKIINKNVVSLKKFKYEPFYRLNNDRFYKNNKKKPI